METHFFSTGRTSVRYYVLATVWLLSQSAAAGEFVGRVIDAASGEPIPARVYLQNEQGQWLFVSAASPGGSAIAYQEQWVPMPGSIEHHTTVSAHPFRADLPLGKYAIEIERGKEYLPLRATLEVTGEPIARIFELTRWINMAERGWYSGETHVHRRISELPNVMPAEELNVAFPVTFWTIRSDAAPGLEPSPLRRQGPSPHGPREDRGWEPIRIGPEYLVYPRNTEYEIFSVDGSSHVLGAISVLNHRSVFQRTAPPIAAIAKQARAEGALIDLEKHSWPWSIMLVPVAGVDLFQLSNNSVWRTNFGFRQASLPLPPWADLESDGGPQALTEWGWLNYSFEIYYALLNCGFRLAPAAGTASGVHPVPLGYSRVYVYTGQPFDGDRWLQGLRAGNSFVTTGPMLLAQVGGKLPGEPITGTEETPLTLTVEIESISQRPISAIEILVDGRVVAAPAVESARTAEGAWRAEIQHVLQIANSAWVVVRSIEPQPDGRKRFAHTAPWHITIPGRPLKPRRDQVSYFVSLMEAEIERNRPVLSSAALEEFQEALRFYRRLLEGL